MRPSPKLPIRRSSLKPPKSSGARAMPHGALSGPARTNRLEQVPAGIVDVDEARGLPGDVVLGVGVLLGVGDDDRPADVWMPNGA